MAKWLSEEEAIHVGDRLGNPKTLHIGVVTVGRRTTVGIRTTDGDDPDYTLDPEAITELVSALNNKLRELIKREPFGGPR